MESLWDICLDIEDAEERDLIRYSQENATLKVKIDVLERKLSRYTAYVNPNETKNCMFDRMRKNIDDLSGRLNSLQRRYDTQREGNSAAKQEIENYRNRALAAERKLRDSEDSYKRHSAAAQECEKLKTDNWHLVAEVNTLKRRLDALNVADLGNLQREIAIIKPELEQYRHFFGNMYYVLKQVKTV